jgi:hypothetical protein
VKYLYSAIATLLEGDAPLKALAGYTVKKMNIRRAYQPTGDWSKLIIYYFQPGFPVEDITPKVREVPLIVRVYDRDDDMNVDDMAERLVLLLDGANLSVAGKVYCYDCSFSGELIPVNMNEELKSFEKVIRFTIRARQIEVVGTTSPANRQRES